MPEQVRNSENDFTTKSKIRRGGTPRHQEKDGKGQRGKGKTA
jgi:hypothetical protein